MSILGSSVTPESQADSFFNDGNNASSPEMARPTWRDQLGLTPEVVDQLQASFLILPKVRRNSHRAAKVASGITDDEWKTYREWAYSPKDITHFNERRFREIDSVVEAQSRYADMMSSMRRMGESVVSKITPYMVEGKYKLNGYIYEFVDDPKGGFLAHQEWVPGKDRKFDETPRLVVLGQSWIPETDRDYRYAQPVDYVAFLRDIIEDAE